MITATMELGKEEGDTEQHMIAELGNLQLNTSKPHVDVCYYDLLSFLSIAHIQTLMAARRLRQEDHSCRQLEEEE